MSQRGTGQAGPPVVSFEDVSKVYGNVRAVDGLSLDLRQGETVAFLGPNGAGVNPLTPRERDVHAASADGSLISEIAAKLYPSGGTVRNYLSACIQKTGARNRAEALRIAAERGWFSWS